MPTAGRRALACAGLAAAMAALGPGARADDAAGAAAAAAQAPAAAAALNAVFIDVAGKVQWRPGDKEPWRDAKVNDTVDAGVEVRTGLRSHAALRMRNATILLDAGTVFQLPEAVHDGEVLRTTAAVKTGRADFKVDKVGLSNDFKVVTPSTTLAVRGTGFAVATGPLKQVEVLGARRNAINAIELKYALNNTTVQLSGAASSSSGVNHPAHAAVVSASPPVVSAASVPAVTQGEVVAGASRGEAPTTAGSAAQAQQSNRATTRAQKAKEIVGTQSAGGAGGTGGAGGGGGSGGIAAQIREQIARANRALEQSIGYLLQAEDEAAEVELRREAVEGLRALADARRNEAIAALEEHEAALAAAREEEKAAQERAASFDAGSGELAGSFTEFDARRAASSADADALRAALAALPRGQGEQGPSADDPLVAELADALRESLGRLGDASEAIDDVGARMRADRDAIVAAVASLEGGARESAAAAVAAYDAALEDLAGQIASGEGELQVAQSAKQAVATLQALVAALAEDVRTAALQSKAAEALAKLQAATASLEQAASGLEAIRAARASAVGDGRASALGEVEAIYGRLVAMRLRVLAEWSGASDAIDLRSAQYGEALAGAAGLVDSAGEDYGARGAQAAASSAAAVASSASALTSARAALADHDSVLGSATAREGEAAAFESSFDGRLGGFRSALGSFDGARDGLSEALAALSGLSGPGADAQVPELADAAAAALDALKAGIQDVYGQGAPLASDRDALLETLEIFASEERVAASLAIADYDAAVASLAAQVASGESAAAVSAAAELATSRLEALAKVVSGAAGEGDAREAAERAIGRLRAAAAEFRTSASALEAIRAARASAVGDGRASALGEVEAIYGRLVAMRLRVLAEWSGASDAIDLRSAQYGEALAGAAGTLGNLATGYRDRGAAAASAAAGAESQASARLGTALTALTQHAASLSSAELKEAQIAAAAGRFDAGAAVIGERLEGFDAGEVDAVDAIDALNAALDGGGQTGGETGGGETSTGGELALGQGLPGSGVAELVEALQAALNSLGDSRDAVLQTNGAMQSERFAINYAVTMMEPAEVSAARAAVEAYQAAVVSLATAVSEGEGHVAASQAAITAAERLRGVVHSLEAKLPPGAALDAAREAIASLQGAAQGFGRTAIALEAVRSARNAAAGDQRAAALGSVDALFIQILGVRARVVAEAAGVDTEVLDRQDRFQQTLVAAQEALGRASEQNGNRAAIFGMFAGFTADAMDSLAVTVQDAADDRAAVLAGAERLEALGQAVAEVEDRAIESQAALDSLGGTATARGAGDFAAVAATLDQLEAAFVGAVAKAVAIDPRLGDGLAAADLGAFARRAAETLEEIGSAEVQADGSLQFVMLAGETVSQAGDDAARLASVAAQLRERFGISDQFAQDAAAAISAIAKGVAGDAGRATAARDAIAALALVARSDTLGAVIGRIDSLAASREWGSVNGLGLFGAAQGAYVAANERGSGVFAAQAVGTRDAMVPVANSALSSAQSLSQMASVSAQLVAAFDGAEQAADRAEQFKEEARELRLQAEGHEHGALQGLGETQSAAGQGNSQGANERSEHTAQLAGLARAASDGAAGKASGASAQAALAQGFRDGAAGLESQVFAFGSNQQRFTDTAAAHRAAVVDAVQGVVSLRDQVVFYDGVSQALASRAGTTTAASHAQASGQARAEAIALASELVSAASQAAALEQTASTNAGRMFGRSMSGYVGRAQAAANAAAVQASLANEAAGRAESHAAAAAAIAAQAGNGNGNGNGNQGNGL